MPIFSVFTLTISDHSQNGKIKSQIMKSLISTENDQQKPGSDFSINLILATFLFETETIPLITDFFQKQSSTNSIS